MGQHRSHLRAALLGATALFGALALTTGSAVAQEREFTFDLPAQPLGAALRLYARTAQEQVIFTDEAVRGRTAPALNGAYSADEALQILLAGTDLKVHRTTSGIVQITAAQDPQGGSAEGAGADPYAVEALIVTAQKKEEDIQDVPIAISAFTQEALDAQKIEGGFDLLKSIPNVTFSKNNFSSYNFSIRGIGTKAISVTTDPGVDVSFNSSTLIRNRLFEQEYVDVERVEVLRGPQGTLYGRNATGGVINVISAKPRMDEFSGRIKLEGGNFETRRVRGHVNVPLIEDVLAVRLAGAMTDRQGYDFNLGTGNNVNGRDLWTARMTIGFQPADAFRADFVWEHFEEDDDRSRTGKQLCHRDPGPETVGAIVLRMERTRSAFSQGCKPGSLYEDAAFGTPNGLSMPFVSVAASSYLGGFSNIGYPAGGHPLRDLTGLVLPGVDPYGGAMQSRDLREISSIRDPRYRAKTDLFQLIADIDLTDWLMFTSQTVYVKDEIYSFQDYNRFNTVPAFRDSTGFMQGLAPSRMAGLTPDGIFCDPQIGCSDSIAGFDISQAYSTQFSQELRVQSSFDGPFNFSAGANYLRYRTIEDYYVMFNLITALSMTTGTGDIFNQSSDVTMCTSKGLNPDVPSGTMVAIGEPGSEGCIYIDPNPVESINGEGHNYFRSKNPYKLNSWAGFGEAYWNLNESTKLTAGLRYTSDTKIFTPVPSQTLLATSNLAGGSVDRGYPELPDIVQTWGEMTGRIGVDWKPMLPITEETLLYAFYSHGYKGGGANPPGIGFRDPDTPGGMQITQTLPYPKIFEPEFVDAFEIGAKNTLLGGSLILNAAAFYYDYRDYQVSQIKERTAVNENFDAKVWGAELEAVLSLGRDLRINATLGHLRTEIAEGERSIDLMDRLQGHNDEYILMRPFPQLASNCVVPVAFVEQFLVENHALIDGGVLAPEFEARSLIQICPGFALGTSPALTSDWPNGGQGFYADLSGNELPNSPHWTASFGAQYTLALPGGWDATGRLDYYWQGESYARVYNTEYDRLRSWQNVNVSLWFENVDLGLTAEVYVKNATDEMPITDAFLNSDDTSLTTNVFTLDPRIVGVSVTKTF